MGPVVVAERRRGPAGPPLPRVVAAMAHELGEGRLEPGIPNGRPQKVLHIDISGAPANLLGRLLVGSYITGQDQVIITARHGLTAAQRKEIHRAVDRILGMTVVGDTPTLVEVQNFIDPGKYELPRLIHRVVQLLKSELEACHTAITQNDPIPLQSIGAAEDEVDRLYLLMVRQLLLSSDNPRIARSIDVQNHHYQLGDRLVAKVLEVTGDLVHGMGQELEANLPRIRRIPRSLLREIARRVGRLEELLGRSMDAFGHLSIVEANATLNAITELLPKDASFGQAICRQVRERKVAVAAQRVVYNIDMALEMLIVVNEVTINRSVEPEPVERSATRVSIGQARSSRGSRSSDTAIAILGPTHPLPFESGA